MPVFEDLMKKKKGPIPCKDGTLPPPARAPEVVPIPMMRVRILRTIQAAPSKGRNFQLSSGRSYELPVDQALRLVSIGLAEQDKSLDSAPETK